jgi:hypothetical protein
LPSDNAFAIVGHPQSHFLKESNGRAMADDRDNAGRFAKGWKGGPGRKPGSVMFGPVAKRKLSELSGDEARTHAEVIVDKAIEQASGGDYRARQWLSDLVEPKGSNPARDGALPFVAGVRFVRDAGDE